MTNKADIKRQAAEKGTGFFSYLRFGESYTSLILGIIVVIIATALLLSFVHNKNAGKVNSSVTQSMKNSVQISQKAAEIGERAPNNTEDGPATASTKNNTSTVNPQPTVVSKKVVEKKVVKASTAPKKMQQAQINKIKTEKDNNIWVVQKDESLWVIAEKKYNNGYKWVDIARINNLSNPSDIHLGDKLILPTIQVENKAISSEKQGIVRNDQKKSSKDLNKITGNSYQVAKGDSLWDISVRAYGDGYKWVNIAQANHLANPSIIHSGNKLKIPRT